MQPEDQDCMSFPNPFLWFLLPRSVFFGMRRGKIWTRINSSSIQCICLPTFQSVHFVPTLLSTDYGHQKIAYLSPINKTAYNKTTLYSGTSGLGKLLTFTGFGFTQLMSSLICTPHLFLQIIQGSEYLQHTFSSHFPHHNPVRCVGQRVNLW